MRKIYDNNLYVIYAVISESELKSVWDKLSQELKDCIYGFQNGTDERIPEKHTAFYVDARSSVYKVAHILNGVLGYKCYVSPDDEPVKLDVRFLDYKLYERTDKVFMSHDERIKMWNNINTLIDGNKIALADLLENIPLPSVFFFDKEQYFLCRNLDLPK